MAVEVSFAAAAPPEAPATPVGRAAAPARSEADPILVAVVVIDADGEPVPAALVEVTSSAGGGTWREHDVLEAAHTDSSGRCTVTARSRKNALLASKAGTGTSGEWPLVWLAEDKREAALVLRAQAKVRGLVLRADGTPTPGARVSFWRKGIRDGALARVPPDQTADDEGRFEVEVDSWGIYGLAAKDGEKRTGNEAVLAEPGAIKEVTLRFAGAFAIAGILLDPEGRPMAAGDVQAWERPSPGVHWNHGFTHGTIGPDGSFRLEVPRLGEYMVAGGADGYADTEPVAVRLTEEAPTTFVSLSLFRASFIAGRVRRETGDPVAGAPVSASLDLSKGIQVTPRPFFGGRFRTDRLEATTGPDGTFRLEPAHPRLEYSLTCVPEPERSEGEIRRRGVVPGGAPLEIVVTEEALQGAIITGVVESEMTGRPLERFDVTLIHHEAPDGDWTQFQPRSFDHPEGRFRIAGLTVGDRYGLAVEAEGHARAIFEPWTMEPGGKVLRVRLAAPTRLEFRVVDAAGRPAPFAEVSIRRRSETPFWHSWRQMRTDESGLSTVERIDPGRYEVRAAKGTARSEAVEAEVRGGSTTTVSIALPK
ncbi:MAG: carboxypeptidase regulatory-like domain-containing protein [Planctomycetota bacterium]